MTDITATPDMGVLVLQHQRRRETLRWRWLALFVGLSLFSLMLDVATGPSLLALGDVVRTLLAPAAADPMTRAIVMDMRLPIALMALVVGAALGLGGVQMQTLVDNPLASPYTLGLAAAAGFGAALTLVTGGLGLPPLVAIPIGSFVFCMLAASLLFGLALMRHVNSQTIILDGIALLFLFQSLLSLLQFLASPELNQQIIFWLFGCLMRTTWPMLWITTGVTLVCALLLHRDAWELTCLRLGEARARSLAVPDGAKPWLSEEDQPFVVTLAHQGQYFYNCPPHLMMGMVGLIQVGEAVNRTAATAVTKSTQGQIYSHGARVGSLLALVK